MKLFTAKKNTMSQFAVSGYEKPTTKTKLGKNKFDLRPNASDMVKYQAESVALINPLTHHVHESGISSSKKLFRQVSYALEIHAMSVNL